MTILEPEKKNHTRKNKQNVMADRTKEIRNRKTDETINPNTYNAMSDIGKLVQQIHRYT